MADSSNHHLSSSSYNYCYNHGLPSSPYHRLLPMVPPFGFRQREYLANSQTGMPLHPQQQPQPSNFGPFTTNRPARSSCRAESNGYGWFVNCDDSWILYSQGGEYGPQLYQSGSFSDLEADINYSQFMPFDCSWGFNFQVGEFGPQPYQSDRFSDLEADINYSQFMPFDCSWCFNFQVGEFGPQPYQSDRFSGRAADVNYSQFMPFNISGVLNSQGLSPDECLSPDSIEEEEEEEEYETMAYMEEITHHWVEAHGSGDVYYGEGLREEIISKNLKLKEENPESDSQICVVCQDCLNQGEKNNIAGLDCGHDFHATCIRSWLRLNNSCPLCKARAICSL